MRSFTDMAERPHFLHSVVRLLRIISLAWGLMACAYAADPLAVEKQTVVPQTTAKPATTSKTVQVTPAPAKDDPRVKVEKKWHIYCRLRRDEVTYGSLQIEFYVNKQGKVADLRVINDKESNATLTELTKQAIKDAKIPPMPAEVIPLLPKNSPDRLKIEYDALIY